MEPILVYGHPAGSSMGLVAALEWLGQPYRLSRVDMLREMRDPSYGRINGRHETPVLVTANGCLVTETMAIAAHLEARDTGRRISFDPLTPEADRMHQLMGFINTGFTGAFLPLWLSLELPDATPEYIAALRQLGSDLVQTRHEKLEEMVGDGPYLVGGKPTLADALLVGVGRWLEYHEVADRGRWPRLDALRRRLEDDPAVRFALALESGDEADGSGALRGHIGLEQVIAVHGKAA
jgi:glutathione S-transferase